MNICYLIDVHPNRMNGGGQVHLLNLVQEMESQISNLKSQIYGASNAGFLSRIIWVTIVIPQVLFHHFFSRRFDLIHAHSIPAMMAGKVLSVILGIPIVVTVHGNSLSLKDGPWRTPRTVLFRFLESFVLTKIRYDAQITVSRDFLKIPNINKYILFIPNGVDLDSFKRSDLGVRQGRTLSDSPAILFVGRKDDPVKGFLILERAMELVRKKIPGVRLIIADGSVPFFRLPHLYQSADLLVIPSFSEGFPLALLEAWASKLPVVATAVGEIPYLVKDGANGFLVPPGDARALANEVIRALQHKNLAKMGESGYNVAKRYSWENVATKTNILYQHILNDDSITNH